MIKIKMYQNNWQIIIGDEIWQFGMLDDMKLALAKILDIKDKFGRIKDSINELRKINPFILDVR